MRILAVALLLHSALAAADTTMSAATSAPRALDLTHADADDASFRRWVTQWASAHSAGVARWGWAQLDDDAAPERFAWVCDTRGYEAGMWILVEDTPDKRWSIPRETDNRNRCEVPNGKVTWERQSPTTIEVRFDVHHSFGADFLAIRGGQLVTVKFTGSSYEEPDEKDWVDEELDFDRRERLYVVSRFEDSRSRYMVGRARSALFIVDGAGGNYRRVLTGSSDVPPFDVVPRAAGKRVMVTVRLARPARVGEALEIWTSGANGLPLAWRATFDGARWQLAGLAHAPRELPPVEGDASTMMIPIVRRATPELPLTKLTIVAASADGATRVATSDLVPEDARTLGIVIPLPASQAHVE
jgi:hypothetical protein